MTTEYMLKQLLEAGEKMRQAQKNYHAAKSSDPGKKTFLIQSKQSEKEFDNAMFNIKQLLK